MYNKIIKALFEAKVGCSINESYATVKERFIKDGANKSEVKSILDLHKKLKDMRRLKDDEINIDVLAKGKSFDEFKTLMRRYSEKDTATKTDKFNELKNNIVAENDKWVVYKIDTIDEAYLFHGLTKWCIVSGSEDAAEKYFDNYVFGRNSNFYFIVRKNPVGDEWDYIALQLQKDKSTYWDKDDKSYRTLPKNLNIPELNLKYEPAIRSIPKYWKLNSDGAYDVEGDVWLATLKHAVINKGKLTIKFNKVTGDFGCPGIGLISLEGCPKEVSGSFKCEGNKLTSLEGGPEKVGGSYYCYDNNLSSLKGSPKKVGDSFYCGKNKLVSLEGSPKEVGGDFWCSDNKLTSLEGAPEKVSRGFYCSDNNLTSLKGAPREVKSSFTCNNNNLTSLKGAPEKVDKDFKCVNNKLTSLEGCPKEVGRDFDCSNNSEEFTKGEVEQYCEVKGDIYV